MGIENRVIRRLKIDGSRFDINAVSGGLGGHEKMQEVPRGTGNNVFSDPQELPIQTRINAHTW